MLSLINGICLPQKVSHNKSVYSLSWFGLCVPWMMISLNFFFLVILECVLFISHLMLFPQLDIFRTRGRRSIASS